MAIGFLAYWLEPISRPCIALMRQCGPFRLALANPRQQALQRAIQSPYAGHMMRKVDWGWEPAQSDTPIVRLEESTRDPSVRN